jgi:hypothetical protein
VFIRSKQNVLNRAKIFVATSFEPATVNFKAESANHLATWQLRTAQIASQQPKYVKSPSFGSFGDFLSEIVPKWKCQSTELQKLHVM